MEPMGGLEGISTEERMDHLNERMRTWSRYSRWEGNWSWDYISCWRLEDGTMNMMRRRQNFGIVRKVRWSVENPKEIYCNFHEENEEENMGVKNVDHHCQDGSPEVGHKDSSRLPKNISQRSAHMHTRGINHMHRLSHLRLMHVCLCTKLYEHFF